MENYSQKLLLLQPKILAEPQTSIPYNKLMSLVSIREPDLLENAMKDLITELPFKTSLLPSFGKYEEYNYMVEISEFKCNILYCERGGYDLRYKCENVSDLIFQIFRIISSSYTHVASSLAKNLDRLTDQRLLLWLKMSSEIYQMYQVNQYFGLRTATHNIAWMCEELVRMGVYSTPAEAFESEMYILKGFTISGMPNKFAKDVLSQLRNS